MFALVLRQPAGAVLRAAAAELGGRGSPSASPSGSSRPGWRAWRARPGGPAGVGRLPRPGRDLRRREQHRQRHARRHPRLGHDGGDLGAGRGRHRRGQPDLPAGAPALRRRAAGPRRAPARTRRRGSGCSAGASPRGPPPVDHPRGGHPAAVPHHRGVLGVPAVLRARRARRRFRRGPGGRARARRALPGRRAVPSSTAAAPVGAGVAARHRPADRGRHRGGADGARRAGAAERHDRRRRCPSSARSTWSPRRSSTSASTSSWSG